MGPKNLNLNSKRVLILEDDELSGRLLQAILVKEGMDVLLYHQGEHALSQLVNNELNIDLVITDIIMPVMGGFDFIEQLKKVDRQKPFMVITSLKDKNTMNKATSEGAADYILKPFKSSDVLLRVRKFFEQQEKQSA